MNETLQWLGVTCLALAFLVALAGLGWWRLATALVAAGVLAALAAAGVGWAVWRVAFSFEHGGGEWRGIGSFAVAVIATAATFLLVFVLTMILLGVTKRVIFRRSPASLLVLGISALLLAGGLGAFTLNTPRHASNLQLVRQLENTWESPEIENEISRRGSVMMPVILAELTRLSKPDTDGYAPRNVPPLLRLLGRLGGTEANAELHRWAENDSQPGIRVAAVCALSALGDGSVVPLIAQFLAKNDGEWPQQRPDLLKALGRLQAVDQVGTIRDVVARQAPFTPPQVAQEGVAALAAIGTDEAWAALSVLSEHPEKSRRVEVIGELHKVPGERSLAILTKALDDPEATVREAAYWSLLRIEPKLNTVAPPPWNEAAHQKMREALKPRESSKP